MLLPYLDYLVPDRKTGTNSVGNWNLAFMMISRRTNDCRTRDYSHERVNKVYPKKILSQFKPWLVLSFSKYKFEGGGSNGR